MKVVGLISGGKDSIYNLMKCKENGHEIICLANLYPPSTGNHEIDSHMYQSVGSEAIQYIGEAMESIPLFRKVISGKQVSKNIEYVPDDNDEVEDLYLLMQAVITHYPDIEAISVGAIKSEYQKNRVENVCKRMGLKMLAYLWDRDQTELLDEMIQDGVEAIIIKVAACGLTTKFLGQTLKESREQLLDLKNKYDINVCGEGGEYETFVLDCPLFKKRINVNTCEAVLHSPPDDTVSYLVLHTLECIPKEGSESS
uniref:Diphthine--ammonia ligase n=1 Tax=Parastrongyloides trichosuri TaxID=131310 RepID=A0A0N4ZKB4_PARTI